MPRATVLLGTDIQGSVMSLSSAEGEHRLAYSQYGHHPAHTGLMSLLGFNGEKFDSLTGHYLLGNGYRAYNPVLMRFNSPDRLSPLGKGGINAYAYCSGNPIGRVDPEGTNWVTAFLAQARQTQGAALDSAGFTIFLRKKYGILDDGGVYGDKATVLNNLDNDISLMSELVRHRDIKNTSLINKADIYKQKLGSGFFPKSRSKILEKGTKKYGS
ncbi:RHS repeat-associated core domain-containing protein [Pseudomonas sp. NPDC096917]|uniref:RHS repeat-associated core domain-containing protein n=1 Tax=Pseudomonas sp. NPDC096917 TaxID=3364483 RepID=UPI003839D313